MVPRVPGFLGCPVSLVRRNTESNHKSHVGNSVEEIKGRHEKKKKESTYHSFSLILVNALGMFVL